MTTTTQPISSRQVSLLDRNKDRFTRQQDAVSGPATDLSHINTNLSPLGKMKSSPQERPWPLAKEGAYKLSPTDRLGDSCSLTILSAPKRLSIDPNKPIFGHMQESSEKDVCQVNARTIDDDNYNRRQLFHHPIISGKTEKKAASHVYPRSSSASLTFGSGNDEMIKEDKEAEREEDLPSAVKIHLAEPSVLLPFFDRPAEVDELLFSTPANTYLAERLCATFRDKGEWSAIKELLVGVNRESLNDAIWLRRLQDAIFHRSPDLFTRLVRCLGAEGIEIPSDDDAQATHDDDEDDEEDGPVKGEYQPHHLGSIRNRRPLKHGRNDGWANITDGETSTESDTDSLPLMGNDFHDGKEDRATSKRRMSEGDKPITLDFAKEGGAPSSPKHEFDLEALNEVPEDYRGSFLHMIRTSYTTELHKEDHAKQTRNENGNMGGGKAFAGFEKKGRNGLPTRHDTSASDNSMQYMLEKESKNMRREASDQDKGGLPSEKTRVKEHGEPLRQRKFSTSLFHGEDDHVHDFIRSRSGSFPALRITHHSSNTNNGPPHTAEEVLGQACGVEQVGKGDAARGLHDQDRPINVRSSTDSSMPPTLLPLRFQRHNSISKLLVPSLMENSTKAMSAVPYTSEPACNKTRSRSTSTARRTSFAMPDLISQGGAPTSMKFASRSLENEENKASFSSTTDNLGHRRSVSVGSKGSRSSSNLATQPMSRSSSQRHTMSFARSFAELTPIVPRRPKQPVAAATPSQSKPTLHSQHRSPIEEVAEAETLGYEKRRDLGLLPDGRTRHPSSGAKEGSATLAAFRAHLGLSSPTNKGGVFTSSSSSSSRGGSPPSLSRTSSPSEVEAKEKKKHVRIKEEEKGEDKTATSSVSRLPFNPSSKPRQGGSGLALGGGFALNKSGSNYKPPCSPSKNPATPLDTLRRHLSPSPVTPRIHRRPGGFSDYAREMQAYKRNRHRAHSSVSATSEAFSTGSQAVGSEDGSSIAGLDDHLGLPDTPHSQISPSYRFNPSPASAGAPWATHSPTLSPVVSPAQSDEDMSANGNDSLGLGGFPDMDFDESTPAVRDSCAASTPQHRENFSAIKSLSIHEEKDQARSQLIPTSPQPPSSSSTSEASTSSFAAHRRKSSASSSMTSPSPSSGKGYFRKSHTESSGDVDTRRTLDVDKDSRQGRRLQLGADRIRVTSPGGTRHPIVFPVPPSPGVSRCKELESLLQRCEVQKTLGEVEQVIGANKLNRIKEIIASRERADMPDIALLELIASQAFGLVDHAWVDSTDIEAKMRADEALIEDSYGKRWDAFVKLCQDVFKISKHDIAEAKKRCGPAVNLCG